MSVMINSELAKEQLLKYGAMIEAQLQGVSAYWPDTDLFEPISYILNLGGKRLRPAMVLAACDAEKGDMSKALPLALAVEIFHNFTLMHDDIMDVAPLRRGKVTVHEKWDANTAILSGDAMLVQAYIELSKVDQKHLAEVLDLFNRTALEVCEGQQRDMAFETREDTSIEDYLEMIRLKTSVLLAAALKLGALVAGASEEKCNLYYDFGIQAGLAFQLQDDYLDAFGDPESFGKQVGGDILSDKKTFLHIRCKELADAAQLKTMNDLLGRSDHPTVKVEKMKALFSETGAEEEIRAQIRSHHDHAVQILEVLQPSEPGMTVLHSIAQIVADRNV